MSTALHSLLKKHTQNQMDTTSVYFYIYFSINPPHWYLNGRLVGGHRLPQPMGSNSCLTSGRIRKSIRHHLQMFGNNHRNMFRANSQRWRRQTPHWHNRRYENRTHNNRNRNHSLMMMMRLISKFTTSNTWNTNKIWKNNPA